MYKILTITQAIFIISCSSGNYYTTNDKVQRSPRKRYYNSAGKEEAKKFKTTEPKKIISKTEFYAMTSFYGKKFQGKPTASGELYNMYHFTCAHKKLPFGTKLQVTNETSKKTVIVKVNDRGPFVKGRDLDLSYAAAKKIGLIPYGVKRLRVKIIK